MNDKDAKTHPKFLYIALLLVIVIFSIDRVGAYLHKPKEDSKSIILYTTEWCIYCKELRAYLSQHRIPYTDHDVEKSIQGIYGYWSLRGRGVPVSVIGPNIIYGFNIPKIEASLKDLGYSIAPLENKL